MRRGDSATRLEGCSCEVENHMVFCWPFTISLSSNRLHAVAPCRGFKSNEHGRYWLSPMANASRPWPFRCNAIRPRSGGCVGAMNRRDWRGSWPRGRTRGIPSRFPPLQRAQIVRLACLEPIAKGLRITHWNSRDLAREAVVEGIVPSISARTVRRILHEVDLQPHRTRYWKTPHLDTQFKQRTEKILWCYAYTERLVQRFSFEWRVISGFCPHICLALAIHLFIRTQNAVKGTQRGIMVERSTGHPETQRLEATLSMTLQPGTDHNHST
jgi:hypothetical protein